MRVKVRPDALWLGSERVAHEVDGRGIIMGVAVGLADAVLQICPVPICQFSLLSIS
jgi:hypothetical protein